VLVCVNACAGELESERESWSARGGRDTHVREVPPLPSRLDVNSRLQTVCVNVVFGSRIFSQPTDEQPSVATGIETYRAYGCVDVCVFSGMLKGRPSEPTQRGTPQIDEEQPPP